MAEGYNTFVFLYYVTDRRQFAGDESKKRQLLLAKIAEAAHCGIDFIQLREKDLSIRELERLAREAVQVIRNNSGHSIPKTRNSKLLINSRIDLAFAAGADGVHLTGADISASDVRAIWDIAARNAHPAALRPLVAVSCHNLQEVLSAESHGADFAVFAPVFEKVRDTPRPGVGLGALCEVCHRGSPPDDKTESVASGQMPVLALGGVTLENARACLTAGAAGIAGIRLFQENEIRVVVRKLREGCGPLET